MLKLSKKRQSCERKDKSARKLNVIARAFQVRTCFNACRICIDHVCTISQIHSKSVSGKPFATILTSMKAFKIPKLIRELPFFNMHCQISHKPSLHVIITVGHKFGFQGYLYILFGALNGYMPMRGWRNVADPRNVGICTFKSASSKFFTRAIMFGPARANVPILLRKKDECARF